METRVPGFDHGMMMLAVENECIWWTRDLVLLADRFWSLFGRISGLLVAVRANANESCRYVADSFDRSSDDVAMML